MAKATLARAAAGIEASAARMSADLLRHERACFRRTERAFTARQPQIRLRTVAGVRNNRALRAAWVDAFTAALGEARAAADLLAGNAADRALEAIRRELGWCERSLPASYAGVTPRACAAVDKQAAVRMVMAEWDARTAGLRAEYRRRQTEQIGYAATVEELARRLFSPTPAGVPGFGGRGVYWQATLTLEQAARWVSVAAANRVRVAAMRAFNDLTGDGR